MENNKEIKAIKNIKMTNEEKDQILSNIFSAPIINKPIKSPFTFLSILSTNKLVFYTIILFLIILGGTLSSKYFIKNDKNILALKKDAPNTEINNQNNTGNTKENKTIAKISLSSEESTITPTSSINKKEENINLNTNVNTLNMPTSTTEPTNTNLSASYSTKEFILTKDNPLSVNTDLSIKIKEFSKLSCLVDCSSSPAEIYFEYYSNGKTESGIGLTQAFGYKITILDTDHKTYAKISVTK